MTHRLEIMVPRDAIVIDRRAYEKKIDEEVLRKIGPMSYEAHLVSMVERPDMRFSFECQVNVVTGDVGI